MLKWERKLEADGASSAYDNFREITAQEMADRLTQLQDAVNAVSLDDDDDDDDNDDVIFVVFSASGQSM